MIFFGSRGRTISGPIVDDIQCPSCAKQEFITFGIIRYFHLYWIPTFLTSRTAGIECTHCKKTLIGKDLPIELSQKIKARVFTKKNTVPMFSGLIIMICLVLFLAFRAQHKIQQTKYIEQPAINDLYIESEAFNKKYEHATTQLKSQFESTLVNESELADYIKLSESVAKEFTDSYNLSTVFANYTTKLLIRYMTLPGGMEIAKGVFNSYVNNIIPYSGLSQKSSDVASNAIVLSIYSRDDSIYHSVEAHILGTGFDIEGIDNEVLLFNLACHYSLKRDKKPLLVTITQALKHGKSSSDFLNDSDFSYYLNDEDFLSTLKRSVESDKL